MITFSKYLIESQNKRPIVNFYIWATFMNKISTIGPNGSLQLGRNIEAELKKQGLLSSNQKIETKFGDNYTLEFIIENLDEAHCKEHILDEIYEQFYRLVEEHFYTTNEMEHGDRYLDVLGVPTFDLEYERVLLTFNEGDSIEKNPWFNHLKKVKDLTIQNTDYLKGGILSILKVPKQIEFQISGLGTRLPQSEILEKYFNSRDILSCHEELVDNGFEEYASI